jgi:hypothetical protein
MDVHVTSGRRNGPVNASAHNSGIAADVKAAGMNTIAMADALVEAGFTGVGEYYEADAVTPRAFAHGDIRGLPGSEHSGAYGPGGSKSGPLCWTGDGEPPVYKFGSRRSGHRCPRPDGSRDQQDVSGGLTTA